MIAVSDDGTGMDKETASHVFEPFFTTKARGKGTGLGLYTVYGIIRQCGCDVLVYSEPGQGATFKIYLPRADREAGGGEVVAERTEAPAGGETVLVIEDEENVRATTVMILEDFDYHVLEAGNGEEAIEIFKEKGDSIDMLITDVVMPGINGKELAKRLLKIRPELKILYVSGYTDNVIAHHGVLESGANFLQKPFTMNSLNQKVREILDEGKV